jgi:hypothetical protein
MTMIFSHAIWGYPRNADHVHKLCILYKRAARIILNIRNFQTPSNVMCAQLNWMRLSDYFVYRKCILVFKVLHGLMPVYLNVFRYVSEISQRQTRSFYMYPGQRLIIKDPSVFQVAMHGMF